MMSREYLKEFQKSQPIGISVETIATNNAPSVNKG